MKPLSWLIRDTFRQANAAGLSACMIGVSLCATAICLTATIVPDAMESGQSCLQLAGGTLQIADAADAQSAVRTLELYIAGWVADGAGLLLALLWTAGFLPSFLEASAAPILLAKPSPRWLLLAGKFLGVLAFVGCQALALIAGTWLALGVRTGIWDVTYFVCLPLLLVHFAIFFSFSAMLAVATRSTPACVFGSLIFWAMCWAMNFGRHTALVLPELEGLSATLSATTEVGYWILPKPLDFHIILLDSLQADNLFSRLVDVPKLSSLGAWLPLASVTASLAAALLLFAIAAYDFAGAEY